MGEHVSDSDVAITVTMTIPVLAVLVVSLIVFPLRRRRIGGAATGLGIGGAVVLLIGHLAKLGWVLYVPSLIRDIHGAQSFRSLNLAVSAGLSLSEAVGLGLFIVALAVRRGGPAGGAAPRKAPLAGYPPPGYGQTVPPPWPPSGPSTPPWGPGMPTRGPDAPH
jgi:hypothetical protein